MANELIINTTPEKYKIVFLEEGKIVEYHDEDRNQDFIVGDIVVGEVKKLASHLNAAFVDIGHERNAFLHYSNLGAGAFLLLKKEGTLTRRKKSPQKEELTHPPIPKEGKIADFLKKGQKVLVQVIKEPFYTKGPRVSCQLSIAGGYIILFPFSQEANISGKIASKEEHLRLQRLISSIRPKGYGLLARTAAQKCSVATLDTEIKILLKKWEEGLDRLPKAKVGQKVIRELNRSSSALRDLLSKPFHQIIIDDKTSFEEIQSYLKSIAPGQEKIVHLYEGKTNILEYLGLASKIRKRFGRVVTLEGGGYLVIEPTEALVVIDVNSGDFKPKRNQEEAALELNLAAVKEVAAQIRLRNLSGIIIVDLVGVKNPDYKRQIYEAFKEYAKEDRVKVNALKMTQLSLLQITRERVRPAIQIDTQEQCPACYGSGQIAPAMNLAHQVEQTLALVLRENSARQLSIQMHPYLHAYFTNGFFSKKWRWQLYYKRRIQLIANENLPITHFTLTDEKGGVLATQAQVSIKHEEIIESLQA